MKSFLVLVQLLVKGERGCYSKYKIITCVNRSKVGAEEVVGLSVRNRDKISSFVLTLAEVACIVPILIDLESFVTFVCSRVIYPVRSTASLTAVLEIKLLISTDGETQKEMRS